ncbi:hypothetical protein [Sphingosinicella rhizophila]|uniref:DUF2388 domain-containing protein n=1 Tax=Sphingosinicella rhizophila TaxID=3050082 RepID=A0ABU3QBA0_9SPHN|nr:hypothetical protein [Sphingosinicella sp. GR2756]MDT9600667.1 hypothetical protein [Sphingosinicella sp. GR2756]
MMRPGAAMLRRPGGLLVLLAFLLSLLPVAAQATAAAASDERLAVQLAASLAFEVTASGKIPEASAAADRDGSESSEGGGAPLSPRQFTATSRRLVGEHLLPPSTAPPASAAADAYQARASPLR